MKIYFDTSVLIAAVLENHPHHGSAYAALLRAHKQDIHGCISGHTLAEFYAVLTRTPLNPPVYPYEALQILETNVLPHFEIASLSGEEYSKTIRDCAAGGWSGGRIYDALHLAAAVKAHCEQVYTFNLRHFRELAPDLGDDIRTP